MTELTAGELAKQIGAVVISGSPEVRVRRPAGLAEAGEGDLSFLANPKYAGLLATTKASVVIVGKGAGEAACVLLEAENPDLAFAKAVILLNPPPPHPVSGIHPSAVVHASAKIGNNVSIGAGAVIEAGVEIASDTVIYPQVYIGSGCRIGAGCVFYPRVTVYHQVTIGSRCIFHAGAVIGSDGFGYAWTGKGYFKIPQVGTVIISDDVEIGANACIDRARFGETVIGPGCKLDNLVQIAHNVKLGAFCAFAAQTGIAGSATIGNGVQMGGQAAAVGHITVGDGITLLGQSAVSKNISQDKDGKSKKIWVGTPAKPMEEQLKEWQNIKALGRLRNTVRNLEKRITELEKQEGDNE